MFAVALKNIKGHNGASWYFKNDFLTDDCGSIMAWTQASAAKEAERILSTRPSWKRRVAALS